jgi:hypothetical protein
MRIGAADHQSLTETLTLYGRLTAARRRMAQAQNAELVAAAGQNRVSAELQRVDGSVRAHEHTHLALVGPYARGGAAYVTIRGPDGRSYAVGGSVQVDLRPVPGDPEATLRKARAIIRAAYGPHQPSAADMRVAANAYRLERMARAEIAEERDRPSRRSASQGVHIDLLV